MIKSLTNENDRVQKPKRRKVENQQAANRTIMKTYLCHFHSCLRVGAAMALISAGLCPLAVQSQITPAQASQFKSVIGSRVEAADILGGDVGVTGASFKSDGNNGKNVTIDVSKFGGAGDIGDPMPLGNLGIGWQPRLQGSMGYLNSKNDFQTGILAGDESEYHTFAIQFGGGARFWLNDRLSLAPTIMGMYGYTKNTYTALSAFGHANQALATSQGLVGWLVDTWTVRPAMNVQYILPLGRTIITASSDFTYFYTESFDSSPSNFSVRGDSETWMNKLDVDVPLGCKLFGHELRTGGYFSRTEFYDDIKTGLNTDHMYELHGRIVLDYLNQLWKVQWIGIGVSYLWGNNFTGVSYGADVAFRF
jgi:hypothetical protein